MVGTLVALVMAGQAAVEQPRPAALLANVFAHYANAQTLKGRIVHTASGAGGQAGLETEVQYERPSKLYVRQRKAGEALDFLVTSDGKHFSYNAPVRQLPYVDPKERMVELVQTPFVNHSVGMILAASSDVIKDRSVPLDIALARVEDLQFIRNTWATLEYAGLLQVNGKEAHVIRGKYRQDGISLATGRFEIAFTKEFDLVRYQIVQRFAPPDQPDSVVDVLFNWDVELKVGAEVDPKLFTVRT